MEEDAGGSSVPALEEGYLLVRIHVPELKVQKCLQFPRDQLVWDVKQQCLAALPKVRLWFKVLAPGHEHTVHHRSHRWKGSSALKLRTARAKSVRQFPAKSIDFFPLSQWFLTKSVDQFRTLSGGKPSLNLSISALSLPPSSRWTFWTLLRSFNISVNVGSMQSNLRTSAARRCNLLLSVAHRQCDAVLLPLCLHKEVIVT